MFGLSHRKLCNIFAAVRYRKDKFYGNIEKDNGTLSMVLRLYNDGVAFRYETEGDGNICGPANPMIYYRPTAFPPRSVTMRYGIFLCLLQSATPKSLCLIQTEPGSPSEHPVGRRRSLLGKSAHMIGRTAASIACMTMVFYTVLSRRICCRRLRSKITWIYTMAMNETCSPYRHREPQSTIDRLPSTNGLYHHRRSRKI